MAKRRSRGRRRSATSAVRPARQPTESYFAAGRRGGPTDLWIRIPELAPLRDKKVVVVGAGGIGAPAILELARAGTKQIWVTDNDSSDPGNAVRWPLGIRVAGWPKVLALEGFIRENWPYSAVSVEQRRIGVARIDGEGESDLTVLETALEDASLVLDATTEMGVQHAVSDLARERGIPYIVAWTTPGAWGGLVARISGDPASACWMCFRQALERGELPTPPGDPEAAVQPKGCADPTFTGAGFDVAEVSLLAVRLAVSTLCAGSAGSYPDADWDVAILTVRTDQARIGPSVTTHQLERDPNCPAASNH